MKKIISIVVCVMFASVALAGLAMAQAKPAAPAAPAAAPAAPAAAPAAPAAAPAPAPKHIAGKIEKGKAGLVLKAKDGEYILAGEDLSKMVGKKVICTGTVAEKAGHKVLTVTAVKAAK
jgi:hypothetical protein